MNIIERQAISFEAELFSSDYTLEIEQLKERIDKKLRVFIRSRDKLNFLKTLIIQTKNDILIHEASCKKANCGYEKDKILGIFLMEQEIDHINDTYILSVKTDDQFSVIEETDLHFKLNEILDRLNKQGLGQEIIFDEIESLKNYFNLGKKTWLQLAYGKVFSVTIDQMIEKSISEEIIKHITDYFGDSIKLLS